MDTYEQIMLGKFRGQRFTDETAINVMLWKYNVSEQACIYDMFFDRAEDIYITQSNEMPYDDYFDLGNLGRDTPLAILTNHGEKDPKKARNMLELFKKHRDKHPYYNGGNVWSEDWKEGARGCLCGPHKTCDTYLLYNNLS